ncbi:hypothetical protein H6P81_016297 [Aristolochia fimbriata]|uniref:Uncharacterized protein n=1 Tax=Aristolochia fimbriata TaxID=158543 RepID=A0AAV7EBP4_ARIFI|nr:hypothetical protein H6P81_016297 [Aristolochia fimbriata]
MKDFLLAMSEWRKEFQSAKNECWKDFHSDKNEIKKDFQPDVTPAPMGIVKPEKLMLRGLLSQWIVAKYGLNSSNFVWPTAQPISISWAAVVPGQPQIPPALALVGSRSCGFPQGARAGVPFGGPNRAMQYSGLWLM